MLLKEGLRIPTFSKKPYNNLMLSWKEFGNKNVLTLRP